MVSAPKSRGNAYDPYPAPQSGGEAAIRKWASGEFARIATTLQHGRVQFLSLDVLNALPARPVQGMICFFAAGVAGATEGTYEYRSAGTWTKL